MINKLLERIFLNPAVYNLYQRIARGNIAEHIIEREINQRDNSYVLDLACGAGVYSYFFNPQKYVGVDTNPRYIYFAQVRNPGRNFMIMDVRHLGFKAYSIDNIIAFGLLHHLCDGDILHMLQEAKSVLNNNGKVLMLDLLNPSSFFNIIGKILVALDRGRYVRNIDNYQGILSKHFKILKTYIIKRWPYEFCIFVLKNY